MSTHHELKPKPDVPLPAGISYLPYFSELVLVHNWPPEWLPFEGVVPLSRPPITLRKTP